MRLLTEAESAANYHVGYALPFHQSGGATSLKLETLKAFADVGAPVMPILGEPIDPTHDAYDWVPLPQGGVAPFVPRGYLICLIMNQAGYDAACSGQALASLTPWQPGDGQAFALIVDVLSQVRNGVARLIVAFSERAEAHAAFPHMKEVMWYTRTPKGLAMTQYFEGKATGRNVTRTFANGETKTMPIFTLAAADWHTHVDAVVEKLVNIEANFSDTLAEVHQKIERGQV